MNIFKLPDLGEGLPDAELVTWHVKVGDMIEQGSLMVSVETAKAIVDIPSPVSAQVSRLYAAEGEIVHTGDPLLEFEDGQPAQQDTGTVVGDVKVGSDVLEEKPESVGKRASGIKATPAVRALARRLEVDLSIVTPSGPEGMISTADVQRAARILSEVGPMEALRGVRRSMARVMSQAHAEVVPVTIVDDVDIHHWPAGTDITLRLVRGLVQACQAEPALNAWYDGHAVGRRLLKHIDLGVAVDTDEGLFVPVLRKVGDRDMADLRIGLDNIKQAVRERSIPPEEMRGHTLSLSNFGHLAGRYANPIVVPPAVAILAAGQIREVVTSVNGEFVAHRMLPLSLSFDHRAVTGGEAARFLAALMDDLTLPD